MKYIYTFLLLFILSSCSFFVKDKWWNDVNDPWLRTWSVDNYDTQILESYKEKTESDVTVWSMMKKIWSQDFSFILPTLSGTTDTTTVSGSISELSLSQSTQSSEDYMQRLIIQNNLQDVFYKFFMRIKSYEDNNIWYCDTLSDEVGHDAKRFCRDRYYIYKIMFEKDISICKNIDKDSQIWVLLKSKVKNKRLCTGLVKLINNNYTDYNLIEDEIKKITWQKNNLDPSISAFTRVWFKEDNLCSDITILTKKLTCYHLLYKDKFWEKFDTHVYPDVINSRYIHSDGREINES